MPISLPIDQKSLPRDLQRIPPSSGYPIYSTITLGAETVLQSESVYGFLSGCKGKSDDECFLGYNFSTGDYDGIVKYYTISGTTLSLQDTDTDSTALPYNFGGDLVKMDTNTFWQIRLRGGMQLRIGSWTGSAMSWGSWSSSLTAAVGQNPTLTKIGDSKCLLSNNHPSNFNELCVISESGGTFSKGTTVSYGAYGAGGGIVWDEDAQVGTAFYNSDGGHVDGALRAFTVSDTTVTLQGTEVTPTVFDNNTQYYGMPLFALGGNGRVVARNSANVILDGTSSASGYTEGTSQTADPTKSWIYGVARTCMQLPGGNQGVALILNGTSYLCLVDSDMNIIDEESFAASSSNYATARVFLISEGKGVIIYCNSSINPCARVFTLS